MPQNPSRNTTVNPLATQPPSPLTTLSIFSFERGSRWWAFKQMGLARPALAKAPGLRFYKLMGSGRGLVFSLKPDWSRYALLAVWEDEASARRFLADSSFMEQYRNHAGRISTLMLRTLSAHGLWSGTNPFLPPYPGLSKEVTPLAVLTRATIRPSRLPAFWQRAPQVSDKLTHAPGLLASIGVGEVPFITQATLSLWQDLDAMRQFAYQSPQHRQTIERTRREKWYSEDLFARFAVLEQIGEFP